jgi:hypothetical protein
VRGQKVWRERAEGVDGDGRRCGRRGQKVWKECEIMSGRVRKCVWRERERAHATHLYFVPHSQRRHIHEFHLAFAVDGFDLLHLSVSREAAAVVAAIVVVYWGIVNDLLLLLWKGHLHLR